MSLSFVGIDPGRKGAIAVIDDYNTIVWPMPAEYERGLDVDGLPLTGYHPEAGWLIGIEWNTARPGEVPDYAFRFGLQTGQLDGWYRAKGFRVKHISPQKWKGFLGLPGKTDDPQSLQGAALWCKLYPEHKDLIYGPRGGILDGNLDALLIAHYLRVTETAPCGLKGGKRPPKFKGLTQIEIDNAG